MALHGTPLSGRPLWLALQGQNRNGVRVVTCYLKYVIDPYKAAEFERYAKMWIPLVQKFGGQHQGYFLPSEGANNIAIALFTFESLAAYEKYREASFKDSDCQAAFKYAEETRCVLSCERSFMRPVFE